MDAACANLSKKIAFVAPFLALTFLVDLTNPQPSCVMCRPKERLPPVKCNQAISCGFLRMLTPYFCLLRVSCFTNVGKQQPGEHFFGQIFPFSAFQSRKKPLENGFPFLFAAAVCCTTRISVIQIVHRTQSLELSQRSIFESSTKLQEWQKGIELQVKESVRHDQRSIYSLPSQHSNASDDLSDARKVRWK